jgi:chemotaxis protein methyltransferase CheR
LFKDSLVPRGFLGLGARETLRISQHADAFEEISPEERVYRRRA